MLATSFWVNAEGAAPYIAVIAAGVIVYTTKGIPKARIEGLEGSVATLETNNAALHDQITLQQAQHAEDRRQDKADCDRRMDELGQQVSHALSEASAARSDVVKAVQDAATAAVRAENREAMALASKVLADGQGVIIGHLEEIKATIGGKP